MAKRDDKPESEVDRIAALPTWRPPKLGPEVDQRYRNVRTLDEVAELRPVQRIALHVIETHPKHGLLGPIGVGHGKGLITFLAPEAARKRRPLLLIPASMRDSCRREYAKFSRHWRVSRRLSIQSYEQLSRPDANKYLSTIKPDMIIADEAHLLRHHDSARTKRVARYMAANPDTVFVAVSGTLTRRSVKDYAHLAEWALGRGSPLPMEWSDLEAFADALDASPKPPNPRSFGYLHKLGLDLTGVPWKQRREAARKVYLRRFESTHGVVSTGDASVGASLLIDALPVAIPEKIDEALRELRSTWVRPDGEELATPLDLARVESCLLSGFYYRWKWPNDKPDREWLDARAAWHRTVRTILKRNMPEYDSPFLVRNGLVHGRLEWPGALQVYRAWERVKHRPPPPVEPVWLDDYLVEACARWVLAKLDAGERGIVWYQHSALGDALEDAGLPVFRAGEDPEAKGANCDLIACSIRAHGTGKNLQRWHANLFMNWQSGGATIEQTIGRTHRQGQLADTVTVDLFAHDGELFKRSFNDARYIEGTNGTRQRLLYATLSSRASALLKDD